MFQSKVDLLNGQRMSLFYRTISALKSFSFSFSSIPCVLRNQVVRASECRNSRMCECFVLWQVNTHQPLTDQCRRSLEMTPDCLQLHFNSYWVRFDFVDLIKRIFRYCLLTLRRALKSNGVALPNSFMVQCVRYYPD